MFKHEGENYRDTIYNLDPIQRVATRLSVPVPVPGPGPDPTRTTGLALAKRISTPLSLGKGHGHYRTDGMHYSQRLFGVASIWPRGSSKNSLPWQGRLRILLMSDSNLEYIPFRTLRRSF